ncbi:MAG: NAD(P)-binding domain-containing protein, partial [Microbacteriaceae bacterium]
MREEENVLMRVGVIGAGRMGAPMVRRLVEAGHDVRAVGRTDEKRLAVSELGATPVADAAGVADGAEVVVICLFTDEQVREVAGPELLSAIPPGAVVIVHTTGSPC